MISTDEPFTGVPHLAGPQVYNRHLGNTHMVGEVVAFRLTGSRSISRSGVDVVLRDSGPRAVALKHNRQGMDEQLCLKSGVIEAEQFSDKVLLKPG